MHQIVSYPETKIGDLQLLEEKEKQQIAEFQGEMCWKYRESLAERYLRMAETYRRGKSLSGTENTGLTGIFTGWLRQSQG